MATKKQLQDQIQKLQAELDLCKKTKTDIFFREWIEGKFYPANYVKKIEEERNQLISENAGLKFTYGRAKGSSPLYIASIKTN